MKRTMKKLMILVCGIAFSIMMLMTAFAGEWKRDHHGWKFFENGGKYFKSSWKNINGEWYYFGQDGYMKESCWIGDYYVGSDGAMYVSSITPDGYVVDDTGKWVRFDFKQFAGEYLFSSGAGGWRTILSLHESGEFTGSWIDGNLGESGEGYDGTTHITEFAGKFVDLTQVNEYTYHAKLGNLRNTNTKTTYIEDRHRYNYTDIAYGIQDGVDFYFYTSEAPMEALPEEFKFWAKLYRYNIPKDSGKLGLRGIYNLQEEYGFGDMSE